MRRSESREAAFLLLFSVESGNSDLNEAKESAEESFGLETDLGAVNLARHVLEKKDELDTIIGKYSTSRTTARIPKVNLIIARIAVYEMTYSETPKKVAVNEAIELAKKYADEQDRQFVSGILGSYYNDITKSSE
ncbi:N utilization substance protein B [Clostridia bacterium]|nr:N utilization substance protein B [Clostridia bacterium]